jgi:hypothetical protein
MNTALFIRIKAIRVYTTGLKSTASIKYSQNKKGEESEIRSFGLFSAFI